MHQLTASLVICLTAITSSLFSQTPVPDWYRALPHAWIETWLDPAFAGWCLDDDLRGVRCPLLALHGDRDEYGSVEHAKRIARLAQGSSNAMIYESCGHSPHQEQPARVVSEIARFHSVC